MNQTSCENYFNLIQGTVCFETGEGSEKKLLTIKLFTIEVYKSGRFPTSITGNV
jgi:hypothetical protein